MLLKKLTNDVKTLKPYLILRNHNRKLHMPLSALVNKVSIVISFVQYQAWVNLINQLLNYSNDLLPSIIRESITDNKRQLYSLPARSRGVGIPVFSEKAENDFDNSVYITATKQDETLPNNKIVSKQIAKIKQNNSNLLSEKVNRTESELLADMKRTTLQTIMCKLRRKVHLAGSRLDRYKKLASPLQNLNSEVHFEFDVSEGVVQ